MRLACREYVTIQGLVNSGSVAERSEAIGRQLHELRAQRLIVGFSTRYVQDQTTHCRARRIDQGLILEVTGGNFPFWVNVTFDAEVFDRRTLEPLEAEHDLRLLIDYTHPG